MIFDSNIADVYDFRKLKPKKHQFLRFLQRKENPSAITLKSKNIKAKEVNIRMRK